MSFRILTPPLSIARELWRYGEPQLAGPALRLSAREALRIGWRAGELHLSGKAARIWPDGPEHRASLLAAIEHLEGRARPASRRRRLPEKRLPPELQASEEERWEAAREMSELDVQLIARGERP